MNFNLNAEVAQMLEVIANTPVLQKMAWAMLAIGLLWGVAKLISAIRWW